MVFVFLFLAYFTLYDRVYVHPHHYKWPSVVPFYGWVIFHRRSWWAYLQGRNRDAEVGHGLVDTEGEGEGGMNWESSIDIYTHHVWHIYTTIIRALWWPRGVGWGCGWEESSIGPGDMYQLVSSVVQLCPILCDPIDYITPGVPVHHQLLELAQTHVHQVGDMYTHSWFMLLYSRKLQNIVKQLYSNLKKINVIKN